VQKLSPSDEAYPAVLRSVFGGLLPPDVWFVGNLDLLKTKAVGFCGSRKATEGGLQVAADCARQLSEHRITVISGYAPGVDMASHEAALSSGGSTIIVLPEGIDNFRIKKTIKDVWDWGRTLVISYFPPNAVWRADRAMDRNKVIVALSGAVIVLEARDKGGTLNAGFCALEMNKPLFVALYEDMNGGREGNQRLLEEGARPLRRSRASGVAEIRYVLEAVDGMSQKDATAS
jgi:DNA processing protein